MGYPFGMTRSEYLKYLKKTEKEKAEYKRRFGVPLERTANPTPKIKESFKWLQGLDSFKVQDVGKKTIRIKGVACKSDVVSRNNRKYVDEALMKSAYTMVGKPVTINHDPKKIVGNVIWAEYEDGALEYLADVKKEPYVSMIKDKSTQIRGVSIDAQYLFNKCPVCGEKFETEESFKRHMAEQHFIKNITAEPHGILYNGLSLVLAPEVPGVPDTSVELLETAPGFNQLVECVVKERAFWSHKTGSVNMSKTGMAKIKSEVEGKAAEQESKADTDQGTPPAVPEGDFDAPKTCPDGTVLNPETGECEEPDAAKAKEFQHELENNWKAIPKHTLIAMELYVLAAADRNITEYQKYVDGELSEKLEKLSSQIQEFSKRMEKSQTNPLKETLSLKETVSSMKQRLEALEKDHIELMNLKEKLRGRFKGVSKPLKETVADEYYDDPIKKAKKK